MPSGDLGSGGYERGRMVFLGRGTGLGWTVIADGMDPEWPPL